MTKPRESLVNKTILSIFGGAVLMFLGYITTTTNTNSITLASIQTQMITYNESSSRYRFELDRTTDGLINVETTASILVTQVARLQKDLDKHISYDLEKAHKTN